MNRTLAITLLCGLAVACGEDGPEPPPRNASVLIYNHSQFEVEEVRIHDEAGYATPRFRRADDLPIDDAILFYGQGRYYLTVFRMRARGDRLLAFTTERPFNFQGGYGYVLEIFDESFRLTKSGYIDPQATTVPLIN